MRPEAALRCERLLRKHIERRARQCAVIESGENVVINLQRAAPGVDQVGAAGCAVTLQFRKETTIENAARI
jgi:hypothetical protein